MKVRSAGDQPSALGATGAPTGACAGSATSSGAVICRCTVIVTVLLDGAAAVVPTNSARTVVVRANGRTDCATPSRSCTVSRTAPSAVSTNRTDPDSDPTTRAVSVETPRSSTTVGSAETVVLVATRGTVTVSSSGAELWALT